MKMTARMTALSKNKFFMCPLLYLPFQLFTILRFLISYYAFVMLQNGKYKFQGVRNIKLLISLLIPLSDIPKACVKG